jgi:hypothetical protein
MAERSVFFTEWRRCLEEHYREVIRHEDKTTEKSLTGVLHRVGFTDSELRELYLEATMKADGTAADFVPDMSKLPFKVHPAECTCAACMDKALEVGHDAEGQPVTPEPVPEPVPEAAGNIFAGIELVESAAAQTGEIAIEPEAAEKPVDEAEKKPKGKEPKQLSMF